MARLRPGSPARRALSASYCSSGRIAIGLLGYFLADLVHLGRLGHGLQSEGENLI